eukprot:1286888-Lingulodinium_polyedra.AAC.1
MRGRPPASGPQCRTARARAASSGEEGPTGVSSHPPPLRAAVARGRSAGVEFRPFGAPALRPRRGQEEWP